MIGERGGTTATLEHGVGLIELHKAELAAAVRADILNHLENHPTWHANDLRVDVTGSSNVVGATVNGLRQSGLIEKTGEWRPATAPASHGRESRVWKLRRGGDGRTSKTQRSTCASMGQPAVISPSGESGGGSLDETPAPKLPVELTGDGKGAAPNVDSVAAPTLFTLDPEIQSPGHVDIDQREAA